MVQAMQILRSEHPAASLFAITPAEGITQATAYHAYYACLRVAPRDGPDNPRGQQGGWLGACYRLTPLIERVSPRCALLGLGQCSQAEALAAMEGLLRQLAQQGFQVRAGLAGSLTVAQLAALRATATQPLVLVTSAMAGAFLRGVPVDLLARLPRSHPYGRVNPEMVEQLGQYGLRTLGHLDRLSADALRRQFGPTGAFLARVAAGQDECPLRPTPLPPRSRVRLRLASPAPPERLLAMLSPLCRRVAAGLRQRGRRAQLLYVRVRWECGCVHSVRRSLRQHTDDPAVLAQALRRLLLPLVQAHQEEPHAQAFDELRVTLGDFAPTLPEQTTLWRTSGQRLAAAQRVAQALARRHARPLLLQARPTNRAAIFAEDRYQLVAVGCSAEVRTDSRTRAVNPGEPLAAAGANAWQAVPQRLHWW